MGRVLSQKGAVGRLVFLAILYVVVSIIGLFLFRGIPVLNVALGFPVGAVVAYRAARADERVGQELWGPSMRTVIAWALGTAGITVLICWFELVGSLLLAKIFGPGLPLVQLLPFTHHPGVPYFFRAQLFAVIVSPGLQILTTVFGGVMTLILTSPKSHRSP